MYLKTIEIQGFKSFAKKITLDFKSGITGIVGPNGSGKSNIADALRWVLGEQKVRSLRGSKMEDVIFAGTEKRNPLSFAYVAITFDNSDRQLAVDFSEVKVARKLYRSGESEYLLNGASVRLKDVRELFYDTGIGKEGYSIIGQGQIDKILQGKSEEKRELFDEACGIVKYKKRKTIALRKLENERLNLDRANDIIAELEKRLPSLKKQSETANDFINYKNELKSLDINLFLYESEQLKKKIGDFSQKQKIASKELESSCAKLSEIKLSHEKSTEELAGLDKKIEEVKGEISRTELVKESFAGQINVLNEQINSAKETESHFYERKEAILSSLSIQNSEIESLKLSQAEYNEKADEIAREKLENSDKLIEIQNFLAQLADQSQTYKEDLIKNITDKGELSARMQRLETNLSLFEQKRSDFDFAARNFLENRQKQEEEIARLLKEQTSCQDRLDLIKAELEEKNKIISDFSREEEKLNKSLSVNKLSEAKARTNLDNIQNLTERYEGYSGAIKEVMALKSRKKGIYGVVADIIKTSKEYETAIETALGGSIQNIVTDNENTAKEAIEYLKANKLGRATFLPLKAVKPRGDFKNPEALNEAGSIGLANSIVSTDPQYLDLCEYLLGKILVVDTIDNALKIARKYRYSFIIVTLEGELLSRGGALSGGAYKNKSNLLGRRREIDDLKKEINFLNKQALQTEKRLSEIAADKQDVLKKIDDLNVSLQEEKLLLNTVSVNLARAKDDENELLSGFENADIENKKALEEEKNIKFNINELKEALKENQAENEIIKEKINESEKEASLKKDDEDKFSEVLRGLDIELSRLKEKQSFAVNSLIKAENNVAGLNEELLKLEKTASGSENSIAEKQKEIEDINVAVNNADENLAALSIKLADLLDKREEIKLQNGDFLKLHDELSENIASLDKEVFRLDQLIEKYEDQLSSKSDYIWHEYELTYNSALNFKTENSRPVSEMKSEISALKGKIRSLGTINVSAIEEYKEVKERFDFLTAQREDILKAEEDLLKIIRDLDRQMKTRFKTEFGKISDEFSRVFKIMFGGGYGRISLCDEEDILNSDIEITAQPPGKKLQNMMQLSGGEKALSAIAVLFSIQNLKPSPFCILDEIEAALDDSNITKFANYLTLLSGKIQFIVITHRKGTMHCCDRLYGVTMQEKGISTLVSVDLEDFNEDE